MYVLHIDTLEVHLPEWL